MIKWLVCLLLMSGSVLSQRGSFQSADNRPLCAGQGDFCYDDRDCCSKACNVPSNKCIINVNLVTPKPLENRFGENRPQTPQLCQQEGNKCHKGRDCCSGECLTSAQKCVRNNRIPSNSGVINSIGLQGQAADSGISCSKENQQCSTRGCCAFLSCEGNICRDRAVLIQGTETFGFNPNNNLANRFGEEDNKPQVVATPIITKCGEIGSKCFKPSDCCPTLQCHGFLHQCVT